MTKDVNYLPQHSVVSVSYVMFIVSSKSHGCSTSVIVLLYIDGLLQKGCDSSAIAMELHLSCTDSVIWYHNILDHVRMAPDYIMDFFLGSSSDCIPINIEAYSAYHCFMT